MGQLISWPKSARVDRSCQCLLIRRQTLSHWAPAKGTPHFLVLSAALPNTSEKDRALAMLVSRHQQRQENYSRELAALLEQRLVGAIPF